MGFTECLNISDQVIHSLYMRRIYPSRQGKDDGYIRKLSSPSLVWDTEDVGTQQFDLERIQQVLVKATGPGGKFSQRSLDTAAEVGRGTVGEIIRGKIQNPTTQVLSAIAQALGGDLSLFGLAEERRDLPSEAELEAALRDMLPGMPRGSLDRRARYLAESVGRALRLPPGQKPSASDRKQTGGEEGAPAPGPTS